MEDMQSSLVCGFAWNVRVFVGTRHKYRRIGSIVARLLGEKDAGSSSRLRQAILSRNLCFWRGMVDATRTLSLYED